MAIKKFKNDYPELTTENTANKINITLSGRSVVEDADFIYYPYIRKIRQELSINKIRKIPLVFDFILDYYNTASTHYITTILKLLEEHRKEYEIIINWHYLPIDEDIYELGIDYQETMDINLNLVERA